MNLTSRSRYALKIMMDLTHHSHLPLVRRQEIVRRQGIPAKYLDQIMVMLRRGGLVDSIRGRSGGYRLGKPITDITVWEIFRTVEEGIYPVECVDEVHGCNFQPSCVANEPWQLIFSSMKSALDKITLAHFKVAKMDDRKMCPVGGIRECRPGREPIINGHHADLEHLAIEHTTHN